MRIRPAEPADAPAVAAIYGHWVETSAASFEETAPGPDTIAARMKAIATAGLPYLVAERDGAVVGYAYLGPYIERGAYRHTAEISVYVAHDARGGGVGRALMERVLEEGGRAGIRQVIAIVAMTDDPASIELHRSLGFEDAGRLRDVGFKHGRWYDTALMQLSLRPPRSDG